MNRTRTAPSCIIHHPGSSWLAILLAVILCIPAQLAFCASAIAETTGLTSPKIAIYYGTGETTSGEWREDILTIDGKPAYCVEVDKHFKSNLNVSACDPVAQGIWSQQICTKLALIDEYVRSGKFVSTRNGSGNGHRVTNTNEQYAVAQCYIWKFLNDAGYSTNHYGWFGASTEAGLDLTGSDTDAQIWEYIRENINSYTGSAKYYDCGNSQDLACNFSLTPTAGYIAITKRSANEDLTSKNSSYSLEGAEYGIYSNKECADDSKRGILRTNAKGEAKSDALENGTYYVKETKASSGFSIDENIYPVAVSAGSETLVNAQVGCVFEQPHTGSISLQKVSARGSIDQDNPCYSLEGALFGIYSDEACEQIIGKMETDADGFAEAQDLPLGPCFVREISAPAGYAINSTVFPVVVENGKTSSVNQGQVSDLPKCATPSLLLKKQDSQTQTDGSTQGSASLANAEFTLHFYPGSFDTAEEAKKSGDPRYTWIFKTSEDGTISFDEAHLVAGDALLLSSDGMPCLPLGTLLITESMPPEGYLTSDETWCVRISDDGSAGEIVESYNAPVISEQVKRGDFEFVKISGSQNNTLAGVPFAITSITTGERHVVVTDANGRASTASSAASHSVNTNGNDWLLETNTTADPSNKIDSRAGIWFGFNGNGEYAIEPDDSMGALPYDTYLVEELSCETNEGLQLVSAQVIISEDSQTLDLGYIDDPQGMITTSALDATDQDKTVSADEKTSITDSVSYSNLIPGKTYTLSGILMNAETGEAAKDANGTEITAFSEFIPAEEHGTQEVVFSFDSTQLEGLRLVVFETLRCDGRILATHENIDDTNQSVTVAPPAIGTQASGSIAGTQSSSVSTCCSITDTISYTSVVPGKKYALSGSLIDAESGNAIESNGEPVTASCFFTPEQSSGSTQLSFEFDASTLPENTQIVVFEKLFSNDRLVAAHEDRNDVGQAITLVNPAIQTSIASQLGNVGTTSAASQITLVDQINYSNLEPGKNYELFGRLMDKDTGEIATDAQGNPIEASTSFIPENSEGTTQVNFEFEGDTLGSKTLVAFETLKLNGETIAEHADLENQSQSMNLALPTIQTYAFDSADGDQVVESGSTVKVTDTVSITDAVPGRSYTVVGMLMNKASGRPLITSYDDQVGPVPDEELNSFWQELLAASGLNQNSSSSESNSLLLSTPLTVDASTATAATDSFPDISSRVALESREVTAEDSSFNVDMEFAFSTAGLSGQVVVFEALVDNETGKLVALHADLDATTQTFEIEPPTQNYPPSESKAPGTIKGSAYDKTGNFLARYAWILALLAASGCVSGIVALSQRHRKKPKPPVFW